jgi:hypothetical protein
MHTKQRARRIIAGTTIALALAAVAAVLAPAGARAGTYVVVQCAAGHNSEAADAFFSRTSDHYVPGTACAESGGGLLLRHQADVTKAGRYGAWSWGAPAGTEFTQIAAQSHVAHDAGHKAYFTIVDASGGVHHRWPREGVYDAVDWTAGPAAVHFSAWLYCVGNSDGNCRASTRAHNHVRNLWFTFRDRIAPTLAVGGSLTSGGTRSGAQTVDLASTDVGGGVWRWRVFVNGTLTAGAENGCDAVAGGVGRRFVPCPLSASRSLTLDTDRPPFHDGANEVTACADDFGGPVNETCRTFTAQVENSCASSGPAPADRLEAGFGGGRPRARIASNRRASIEGRLLGRSGEPIRNATICALSTVAGGEESREGQVRTDSRGRFAYLPLRGPSRQLRLVYRHGSAVVQRVLDLTVRVRPRLKVGPRARLHNGQVARFRGKLPGPSAARRIVVLQVRIGRRWQAFRTARTRADGRFRARYRFRATTSRRLYRFRALVREQAGYPYARGTSPTRRIVVNG